MKILWDPGLVLLLFFYHASSFKINRDDVNIQQEIHAQFMQDSDSTVNPVMATIPVRTMSFIPRNNIKTRYFHRPTAGSFVTADMTFNTSRPCIHLDNLTEITNIKCGNGEIILNFDNKTNALDAYTKWINHPELTVLVGWERQCAAYNEVGTFGVRHIVRIGHVLIFSNLEHLKRKHVVLDWHLEINQYGIESSQAGFEVDKEKMKDTQKDKLYKTTHKHFKENIKKERRSLVDEIKIVEHDVVDAVKKEFNESIIQPLQHTLQSVKNIGKFTVNKTKSYDFTSNYNEDNNTVINPDIEIYKFLQAVANCQNCYTVGKAHVRIEMQGRIAAVSKYKLIVNGDLKVNADFKIIIRSFWELPLVNIIDIPLFPISITGMFALSPRFRVGVGISYGAITQLEINTGFDFFLPLDFEIYSANGMLGIPKYQKLGTRNASVNVHKITGVATGGRGWISATISPKFIWGFVMLPDTAKAAAKPGMLMALYFENSLGVQLQSGSLTSCPVDTANLGLYHDSQLNFIISVPMLWKIYRIFRFKNVIKCWFCNECGVSINGTGGFPTTRSPFS